MRRALLDTSVLIGGHAPGELEGAISAASLAELHFGVLVTAPRLRAMDLAIAATANVAGVPLLTHDAAEFAIIDDLVDVSAPDRS